MTNTVFDDMCQGEELHVIAAVKSKRHAGGKHAIIVGSTVGKPHWRVVFDPNPERGLAYVEQSILTKDELISLLIMSPLVSTFEQWGWR